MPLLDVRGGESVLDRVASVAHRHLAMDAVYVAELTPGEQIYRSVAGDAAGFGVDVGRRLPRDPTFCHRLVTGEIPNLIPDTTLDPRVSGLPGSLQAQVGAYVGVPLRYSDGRIYGTICGLARQPDMSLDDRDVRFLTMLAELLIDHLDEADELRAARAGLTALIEERRLDIAAQPILRLRDGVCLGIEALSRFPSGSGNPAEMFAAAERVGVGVALERLAILQAMPLLDTLGEEQFLTVNVSPSAAMELIRNVSTLDGLPLDRLVVELTEHAAISGYGELRELLQPLRDAGLRVAVDDAGAGYASLRHVVELRPDFIKVDRDLVHGLADDHARRVAVSAFVLLALDLNASVIAEGLERPTDLAALCDLGVDAAQGFLLGRPNTNLSEISEWLTAEPRPMAMVDQPEPLR